MAIEIAPCFRQTLQQVEETQAAEPLIALINLAITELLRGHEPRDGSGKNTYLYIPVCM